MGLYDAIKDCISVAQKADNIPLLQSLIDLQQQAFDLIQENQALKKKIEELKAGEDISSKIERHNDAYITLSNDEHKLIYCSCCWDTKKILVQTQAEGDGKYFCPACKNHGYYDRDLYKRKEQALIASMRSS